MRSSQAASRSCRSARLGLGERPVGGIANQEMPEAVGLVVCEDRSVGPDHVAADEPRQTALDEGVRQSRERARGSRCDGRSCPRPTPARGARARRSGRPSSRAASSVLIVCGHRHAEEVARRHPADAVPPRAARRRPASPAAPRRTARCRRPPRRSASPPRPGAARGPSRFAISLRQSPSSSGSSSIDVGVELAAGPAGWLSKQLRAAPCRAGGSARRARAPRGSRRESRNVGSAHCRSSNTTTSGRRCAMRLEQLAHRPGRHLAACRRRRCRDRAPRRSARRSDRPCPLRGRSSAIAVLDDSAPDDVLACRGSPARPRSTAST